MQKINLFAPHPKGRKLIFFTPFRDGANEENQSLHKVSSRIINKKYNKMNFSKLKTLIIFKDIQRSLFSSICR
jgi:hypothetical protein